MKEILVIDDNSELCEFLQDLFSLTGEYRLVAAETGRKGIKAAHRDHPDLILLDIDLPDIHGLDVLRHLKESTDTYDIPVLMLTGLNIRFLRHEATKSFADGYVAKPFDPEELEDRVNRALAHAHGGSFAA